MHTDQKDGPPTFCIVGAGFIFDRHLSAIESVGGKLLAVVDCDVEKREKLDSGVAFFASYDEFFKSEVFAQVETVVICTPNYTHFSLARLAHKDGKNVLCEKPAVLSSAEADELFKLSGTTAQKLFFVHQLRQSPQLQQIRQTILTSSSRHEVEVTLKIHRGEFYWEGWKGDRGQSGGVLLNIGVHYIDLLVWLFGTPLVKEVFLQEDRRFKAVITFEKAVCAFELDLTAEKDKQSRVIRIDDTRLNLTRILESLHNEVYRLFLKGEGTRIEDIAGTIKLCEELASLPQTETV